MLWGNRSEPAEPRIRMPVSKSDVSHIKQLWWGIFSSLIEYSTDDVESLLRAATRTKALVGAARDIADAAIEEYEDRWTGQ